MIIINNVNLPLNTDFSNLKPVAATVLKENIENIESVTLHKKSVDARRRNDIHFCCSILVSLLSDENTVVLNNKNSAIYLEKNYIWRKSENVPELRPVVVGFGPAGIFAALTLARAGLKPIIVERGFDVDTRIADVNRFFSGGELNENSNIQFGEGGAGTFSDGKLNTGIKDVRCRTILKTFIEFGADPKILYEAKPHIGTDVLINIVKNMRNKIISLGGEIKFGCQLNDIEISDGKISSITAGSEKIPCERLILAIGHSARDTFELLKELKLEMQRKPFAVGVRIEHLQSDINNSLYGEFAENPALEPADYKLAVHLLNGRSVFTFCMCPGGEVINASSENSGIAINGMSNSARDGANANSALLVGINPEDFESDDILGGCYLQRDIEKKAFEIGKGKVPVTTVGNFVFGKDNKALKVRPTVKPGTVNCDLTEIFPEYVTDSLKKGIMAMDKKLTGFYDPAAIITAPETRSSSPIRILRNEVFESVNITGLYPSGEGAGYAGGIMSAAVDGIKAAEAVLDCYNSL